MAPSIVSPESFTSFGDLLKHLRLRAGLTQRELAISLGYNFAHLSRLEHNLRTPEAATIKALFIPALGLESEPAWAARLLELSQNARSGRSPQRTGPLAASAPQATSAPTITRPPLPYTLTPLVGRQVTLEAVEAMLTNDSVRLLTLLGPPGIGKTRLAQQVAVDLADHFADGVRLADLTSARTVEDVIRSVAEASDLREAPGETLEQGVAEWLSGHELLLVLDNFEHVVATAPQLTRWLQAMPGLTILVTSREALRLAGEQRFPVPALAVPVEYRLAAESDPYALAVASYPSVELFVQRARAAQPDFKLTLENATQVAELCHRLDGLPLAIELAAARIRHLSLAAMLDRLDRRLQWLTGGPREGPTWRQTLRGAIDWSYDLLDSEEQAAWRSLVVFAGPFTAEAAEAVIGTTIAGAALDVLLALADKSLVQSLVDATGDSRFTLLETLREYGLEKCAAGEADLAARRHAAFYLELARTAEGGLTGAQQQRWLQRLELEKPNWLAALRWCATQAPDIGLQLATAVSAYWQIRGQFAEGRQWLDDMLTAGSPQPAEPATHARSLRAAAYFDAALGNTQRAEQLAHESLRLARAAADPHELADSLSLAGRVALWQSDYGRARPRLLEALAQHRQLGDRAAVAVDLDALGVAVKEQGDYARAAAYHEESLALSRALDNTRGIVAALTHLGIVAYWQGDFARVAGLAEECIALCRQIDARDGTALALESLAMASYQQGEHGRAREWLAEALSLYEETSNKGGLALVLDDLGTLAHAEGDVRRAVQMHRKAFELAVETGERRRAAFCLEGLGAALAEADPALAVQLLSGAQALRQLIQAPVPPTEQAGYDAVVAQLRAKLDQEIFAAAWAAGQTRSLADWKDSLGALAP